MKESGKKGIKRIDPIGVDKPLRCRLKDQSIELFYGCRRMQNLGRRQNNVRILHPR
jgi:hypothetical protein